MASAAQNLVDLSVVLHEPGDDDADVVDGQLGHEAGEDTDHLAMGFLAVLDHPLQQGTQHLVLLFHHRQLGVHLPNLQIQILPAHPHFLDGRDRGGAIFIICHEAIIANAGGRFQLFFCEAK